MLRCMHLGLYFGVQREAQGPSVAAHPACTTPAVKSNRSSCQPGAAHCPSVTALAPRFLEELSRFDYQAVEGQLPPALGVVKHLARLLGRGRRAGEAAAAAEGQAAAAAGAAGEGTAPTPTAAALHGAAEGVKAQQAERVQRAAQQGDCSGVYDPYVPGRVVFIYRQKEQQPGLLERAEAAQQAFASSGSGAEGAAPAALDEAAEAGVGEAHDAGSSASASASASASYWADLPRSPFTVPPERVGRVLVHPSHPALRSLRLTRHLLYDHFIDTAFSVAALAAPAGAAG